MQFPTQYLEVLINSVFEKFIKLIAKIVA
jgi:hypothetical protein